MQRTQLLAALRSTSAVALIGLLVVTAAACGKKVNNGDEVADAGGPGIQTCETAADCSTDVPECSYGLCKRPCAANDGCVDPATFCNATTGYCEPGCRDSSVCPNEQVCSGGACIVSQGCATKCDCAVGQVCASGVCQDPPPACRGADDCGKAPGDQCEDFQCNGFTQLCFDPDPEPCASAQDCIGRPGCADGCACTGNGQCVPRVACTAQDEGMACGAGNYCDGNGTCQPLPSCTTDGDCASAGLVCNVGIGQCRRSQACSTSANCAAPTSYCSDGFCAQPLCTNGGVTCSSTQTCSPDGRCVNQGQGGTCTSDTQCDADEYCSVVGSSGQCTVGCRGNSSCPQGQVCNGARTCVAGGGGGGGNLGAFGATCTDDSECQAGLICGTFTGTCAEPCDAPGETCENGNCCALSGAACCNSVLILGFCGDC